MKGSVDSDGHMPLWVKVFGVIALVLVVVVVVLALMGNHGPGRHSQSIGSGGYMRS